MGQKHSKPSRNLGDRGSTRAGPRFRPPDEPPPAYECEKPTWLPRENVLDIMENVNAVMKEAMDELVRELDGSPDVLVAAGHIREACTAAARTVTRTTLPNVTQAFLDDDLVDCHVRIMQIFQAISRDVAAGKITTTILILANAVTKAAYKAKSGSRDYRTGAWAAILAKMVLGAAGTIAMRVYKAKRRA